MNTKRFSLLCMLLGLFLIIYGIYISYIIPQCQSGKSPQIQQTATINDISLGMRTVGTNPQGKTVDEIGEPNSSWFQIKLRMVKQNQGVLNIELLRPQEWLHAHNVFPGNIIPMDMPEMGAVGGAEVLSVSSAPPIQSGKGNVVSGKFIHEATNCIDLHIEGHDNPIGCTDNHPFWSEDRQEFIPAGELNQGERVLLYSGETARIAQKLPRPGPETVYNLEIWGEHVYHVGNDGVLVHNACEPLGNNSIRFGNDANQVYHAFRHIDAIGLSRSAVQSAVETHLNTVIHEIPMGKPFNQTITVNGIKIQYTAYKLPNGEINVGRIHPVS